MYLEITFNWIKAYLDKAEFRATVLLFIRERITWLKIILSLYI